MQEVVKGFAVNVRLVGLQVDGIPHEASVGTGGHPINSLNWIVGHIVQSRDRLLRELGGDGILDPDPFERYNMGADPIEEDGPDVIRLERLVTLLEEQQRVLAETLGRLDDASLEEQTGQGTRRYRILRYLMHDSFHTGQTDVLGRIVEGD